MELSGMTVISASNFSMRSSRVVRAHAGGKRMAARRAAANSQRSRLGRRRMVWAMVPRLRSGRVEADLGRFALGRGGNFEKLAGLEAEHPGKNIRGELLDFGVEVADNGVVIAARVLDGVLDLRQGILQRSETLDGAKLRISLGKCKETFQRAGEHVLRLGLVGGAGGGHGAIAGIDDRFEGALFVSGVALHGFDEVWNQVVTAFELNIYVGPGVVAGDLKPHQSVVHADEKHDDQKEDAQNNPANHRTTSRVMEFVLISGRANVRGSGLGVKPSRIEACTRKDLRAFPFRSSQVSGVILGIGVLMRGPRDTPA